MFATDFQSIVLHVSYVTFLFLGISGPNFAKVISIYPRIRLYFQKSAGMVIGDPGGVIPLPGGFIPEI